MSVEDERRERYLWDPGAEPDAEVQALEERLAPARFDPRRRPLTLLPSTRRRAPLRFRAAAGLAAAAAIVLAMGVGAYWSWRWS